MIRKTLVGAVSLLLPAIAGAYVTKGEPTEEILERIPLEPMAGSGFDKYSDLKDTSLNFVPRKSMFSRVSDYIWGKD
jgi:hypothetical protein